MARPRRATPKDNAEARYIASRIQDAKRRTNPATGKRYTDKEIGAAFGINERTVRKIRSGETSGTRIYKSKIEKAPDKASPSIVRLDLEIGTDVNGNPVVRTVNAKVPALTSAKGKRVAPTPFDVFRLPDLSSVATAEGKRLQNQYAGSLGIRPNGAPRISTIRPILRRNPSTRLVTITGSYR